MQAIARLFSTLLSPLLMPTYDIFLVLWVSILCYLPTGTRMVVLLVVFAVSVKAALPDLPLKEILRPGTVVFILAAALVLGLADLVLPTVWQGYDARTQLVWRVGATCLLAFVCCAALSRHGTSPVNKADAAPEKPRRTEVEQAAMALADSVCPPKR